MRFLLLAFCQLAVMLGVSTLKGTNPEAVLLWSDSFYPLITKGITPSIQDVLHKKGLDPEIIKKTLFPQNWTIMWSSYGNNCFITPASSGITVHAERFSMLGRTFKNTVYAAYNASCEIKGNGTFRLGFYKYGTEGGPYLKDYALSDTDYREVTIELKTGLFDQLAPMIEISGNVDIRNFKLSGSISPDMSVISGTVEAISAIPSPAKSDYPDCYYTVQFKADRIVSGASLPQTIQLTVPAFLNQKPCRSFVLAPGDMILATVARFNAISTERQSIQQSDDLNLYDHENFFAYSVTKLPALPKVQTSVPFSTLPQYTSVFSSPLNPPLPANIKTTRQEVIKSELKKVNALLDSIAGQEDKLNKKFSDQWAKIQKMYQCLELNMAGFPKSKPQKTVWCNLQGHYFTLPTFFKLIEKGKQISARNVTALKSLNEFLAFHNVQFIIQIIPDCNDIAARVVVPEFRTIPDASSLTVAKQLLENDIEVIYCSDEFTKRAYDYESLFCYPNNTHPHDGCQDILTDLAHFRLSRFDFQPNLDQSKFSSKHQETVYKDKYTWPEGADLEPKYSGGEVRQCNYILYNEKLCVSDAGSPVLIVGSSWIQTPMYDRSYMSYLSKKMNMSLQERRVSGAGVHSTIIKELFSGALSVKGKKIIILPVAVSHLTSSLPFRDIREMDRQMQSLSGKKMTNNIALSYSGAIPADFPEELSDKKDLLMKTLQLFPCQLFHTKTTDEKLKIATIPANQRGATLVITGTIPDKAFGAFEIAGHTIQIPTNENNSFEQVIIDLPPLKKEATLVFRSKDPVYLLIRQIAIFSE